jgi:hypothetical protein
MGKVLGIIHQLRRQSMATVYGRTDREGMLPSVEDIEWKCDPTAKRIIIPASVTRLDERSFEGATTLEEIAFEPGSQLRELWMCSFSPCVALNSIYIPASIEIISSWRPEKEDSDFSVPAEHVIFEAGSKLREIGAHSFHGYYSLKSICLPASVESIEGNSFLESGLEEISFESGNRFFRLIGPFLQDFEGVRIIRCFGSEKEIRIGKEIETVGAYSFFRHSVSIIRFESMSQLSLIEKLGFGWCSNLQSISIPPLVKILGDYCFQCCDSLEVVSFEPDSQLVRIEESAFSGCGSLKSIALPSTLEVIGRSCFFCCGKLEAVILTQDSKLVRIEPEAFGMCFCLRSLSLPPLLEFVGERCFDSSFSLSTFIFSSQSHLRELLDLPCSWRGLNRIPDSVEVLEFHRDRRDPGEDTLIFGQESSLRDVRINSNRKPSPFGSPKPLVRYFLQVSSGSLKHFRLNLEFESSR